MKKGSANRETRRIRVAFCHNYVSPYRIGFFEKLYHSANLDVDFYFGGVMPKGLRWDFDPSRLTFTYRILTTLWLRGRMFINPVLLLILLRRRYDVFVSGACDYYGMYLAYLVSRLVRKSFILWSGETIELARTYRKSVLRRLVDPIASAMARNAEMCIAYGEDAKAFLVGLGVGNERIAIALNAPDLDFIDRAKCEESDYERCRGTEEKRPRAVLYVGRLEAEKRVDLLIRAFKQLNSGSDLVMLIIGDGPLRPALSDLCSELGLRNTHFLGHVPRERLPHYYSQADLFVMPGTGGVALQEALYCGMPVVASESCCNASLMIRSGENGYVVRKGDVGELCLAMRKILEDPDLARKMGANARRIGEDTFSVGRMANVFESVIRQTFHQRAESGILRGKLS